MDRKVAGGLSSGTMVIKSVQGTYPKYPKEGRTWRLSCLSFFTANTCFVYLCGGCFVFWNKFRGKVQWQCLGSCGTSYPLLDSKGIISSCPHSPPLLCQYCLMYYFVVFICTYILYLLLMNTQIIFKMQCKFWGNIKDSHAFYFVQLREVLNIFSSLYLVKSGLNVITVRLILRSFKYCSLFSLILGSFKYYNVLCDHC